MVYFSEVYFSDWPVPMHHPSQMPRATMSEHDAIFAADDAVDKGGGVRAGAAMISNLGRKVSLCPTEPS